jgi:hypothetical protein
MLGNGFFGNISPPSAYADTMVSKPNSQHTVVGLGMTGANTTATAATV